MTTRNPLLEIDKQILGEAYTSDEAYRNLITLCDELGSRFGGTEDEKRAIEFATEKSKEYGLDNSRAEQFEYNGWKRSGHAKLETTSPMSKDFPCISLPYCPATGQGGIEGELVNVGDGAPDDYERAKDSIEGNIVMTTSKSPPTLPRWMHRMEKFGRAIEKGAIGFVYVNHYDGLLPATGSLRSNRQAEIPGIGIAKETGASILRLKDKGQVNLRITTSDINAPMPSWNAIADLRGSEKPDEMVIVGGHIDGHDISQGAVDNASGTCVILETARLLAKLKPPIKRTIRFICFSLEEIGLIGAHKYVEAHQSELDSIRFMLNIDSPPRGKASGLCFDGWPQMKDFVEQMGEEMKYDLPFADKVGLYSDQYPFLKEGVPSASLANITGPSTGRGFGHTPADTVDKVDLRDLREGASVVARTILRIANAEDWPVERRSKEEVRNLLEEKGLEEILRFEGREV